MPDSIHNRDDSGHLRKEASSVVLWSCFFWQQQRWMVHDATWCLGRSSGRLMGKSLVLFSFSYTYVEGPHGGDFLGKQGEGSGKENGGGGEGFGGD